MLLKVIKRAVGFSFAVCLVWATVPGKTEAIFEDEIRQAAAIVYENAGKTWDAAVAAEDPLTEGFDTHNFLSRTIEIIRKYGPVKECTGKPKVLPHEEFEQERKGNLLLFRGISAGERSAEEYASELKYGDFFDGKSGAGIYASSIKSMSDLSYAESVSQAAESYALNKPGTEGRICTFFFGSDVTLIDGARLTEIIRLYGVAHPELFEDISEAALEKLSPKELFMALCLYPPQADQAFALLLGRTVVITDRWKYQFFDRSRLVFDAQDTMVTAEKGDMRLLGGVALGHRYFGTFSLDLPLDNTEEPIPPQVWCLDESDKGVKV